MKSSKSEMTWKTQVADKYFKQFTRRYDEKFIDLLVEPAAEGLFAPFLWAETKKQITSVPLMYAQLLLTIKPAYDKGEKDVPKYLGVFDNEKICFVEFYHLWDIINANGFNWKDKPSNVSKSNENITAKFLTPDIVNEFVFGKDDAELKKFIKENFTFTEGTAKLQITESNFLHVFRRWLTEVRPTIAISDEVLNDYYIIDGDFYLADLLSENNCSIKKSLKVQLEDGLFQVAEKRGYRLFKEIFQFTDGGQTHTKFWNRYHRPPAKEYWDAMIDRRELLVPQGYRERRGSFFTPQIWVKESQKYLSLTFGKNWQDKYYVWDCCCGTGNMEVGLTNPHNVFASAIDKPDIDVIHELIDSGRNLLHAHVFQFDFLNDEFVPQSKGGKIPDNLYEIINDPQKRKKLIIYINPPYAEHGNKQTLEKRGTHKSEVSASKTKTRYKEMLGAAGREVYAMFFMRILEDLHGVKLASFSKLKHINAQNFVKFRQKFQPEFLRGFICPANSFDNVSGEFPLGFLIWDTKNKKAFDKITCDIRYYFGVYRGRKNFYTYDGHKKITQWERELCAVGGKKIGVFHLGRHDFQNAKLVFIETVQTCDNFVGNITKDNILPLSVCFAVQHCIEHDWTIDRDQFLYPNIRKKQKENFQNNCLAFTLFHSQNRITGKSGINHWIPFKAKEVKSQAAFMSDFMIKFLKGRRFGKSAQAVFAAGKALWTYYHETVKSETIKSSTVKNDAAGHFNDASLYDIRAYFKGMTNGRVNAKSKDETFTKLDTALKDAMKVLAEEIKPCVYEYGFLME